MREPARSALFLALLASCWPASSRAQQESDAPQEAAPEGSGEAAAPENMRAAQEAREHFRQGMAYFDEHRFRDAIHEFQVAAERVPSADLWFNIARAHEELSEYDQAAEYYRRYLRDRVDPPDREQIERLIAALEERAQAQREAQRRAPTTGTMVVHASQPGGEVSVDGQDLGETPMDLPLSVDAGTHRYDVEAEGRIPFRSEVTVEAGVPTGAYAELVPLTEYRAVYGKRRWTWVVGGIAAAALGTSLGLGAYAVRTNRGGDYARAGDFARYSDILLGVGLTTAVTAVILYFIEGRAIETQRVRPVAGRGLALTF